MPFIWFLFGAGLTAGVVYFIKRDDSSTPAAPTGTVYTLRPTEIWQIFVTFHVLKPLDKSAAGKELENPLIAAFKKIGIGIKDGAGFENDKAVLLVTVPTATQLKVGTVLPIVGSSWADSVKIDQIIQAPASVPPSGNVSAANFP